MDFSDKNLPRTFRNLKTHVLNHVKSDSHIKARNEQLENDKKDQDDESYNYKVGMKLARKIYANCKERESYHKYERDLAQAYVDGEEIGNINHGRAFAKELLEDIATTKKWK